MPKAVPTSSCWPTCPIPWPGPGEVVIDAAYAGCNWADTQVRQGIYPHRHDLSAGDGLRGLGDCVGARRRRDQREVGDRVATFPEKGGGYAEKCVAGAAGLIKLPDSVPLDVGAAFPIRP